MPTKTNSKKPSELGYRLPAEWEPHEATWLAWPHDRQTWPNELEEIEAAYIEIIEYLHAGEVVRILVDNEQAEEAAAQKLKERGINRNVTFHHIETNSIWIRDYGPIFLKKVNQVSAVNWQFNAWGGKYNYPQDKQAAAKLTQNLNIQPFEADLVLEGGSIDVNGEGVLLTTEECLLNPNRNPKKASGNEYGPRDFTGTWQHLRITQQRGQQTETCAGSRQSLSVFYPSALSHRR